MTCKPYQAPGMLTLTKYPYCTAFFAESRPASPHLHDSELIVLDDLTHFTGRDFLRSLLFVS